MRRIASAVGSVMLAATMLGIGTAGTASASESAVSATCSTRKVSSQVAEGWCSSGVKWRLGIRCSNGQYQWTTWYSSSTTVRLACLSSTTLTHYWIDTA